MIVQNLYVHPDIPIKKFNDLVFKAWAGGTKSTYYTKSSSEKVIAKVVNQAHIITREDCPYCEKAKLLFTKLGIRYTEYKREDVPYFPWKTVPQIWYQGHFVGGYDDLLEFLAVKKQKVAERQMNHTEAVRAALQNVVEQEDVDPYEDCSSCSG